MLANKNKINNLVKEIITHLKSPTIILMSGDLGTGKTTLTKTIFKELGIKTNVFSPTFLIKKDYRVTNKTFVHYDLYRISNFQELSEIGFQEDLLENNYLIVVEWPEKVSNLDKLIKKINPRINTIKITLAHTNDLNLRDIKIQYE